jgi:hypothetical protein
MAAKKDTSAMDFIVAHLKKNKKATYAEVREAAEAKKLSVYPIMYGRAQALLGYVPMKPRGQGKAAAKKAAAAAPVAGAPQKRGPGRPRKNPLPTAVSFDAGGLDGIISAVRTSEQQKARYRAALEKIQSILADALA